MMPINTHTKSKLPTSLSYESLYSSASSRNAAKVLYQRKGSIKMKQNAPQQKQQQNLEQPQSGSTNTSNNMQEQMNFQKNLSARFYRVKSFQNQLTEAQHTINSLTAENRMLLTLHRKQEVALAKYEAANEDLPKLINSHAEEVRVWEVKCNNIKTNIKELDERLHKKEALIYALTDQKNYYAQLNKNKQLEERKNLNEQRLALEAQLNDISKQTKQSVWRLEAELKHLKQLVAAEEKKLKLGAYEMEKMRIQLGGYKSTTQQIKNLSFIKEDAELTETSVAEDTDTLPTRLEQNTAVVKNRVLEGRAVMHNLPRLQNPLAVKFLSEDVSSIQSCDVGETPVLTEDERKSDRDLNSCVSNCSFNGNLVTTTDCSISEDENHVLNHQIRAEELTTHTIPCNNGNNINKLLASLKSCDLKNHD